MSTQVCPLEALWVDLNDHRHSSHLLPGDVIYSSSIWEMEVLKFNTSHGNGKCNATLPRHPEIATLSHHEHFIT